MIVIWTGLRAALAFYKQAKLNKCAHVRISIQSQPGIDTGIDLDLPSKPQCCPLECLLQLAPWLLIAYYLMGRVFRLFAGYCYYYMAGCHDQAITCITTVEDVGLEVKTLNEVRLDFLVYLTSVNGIPVC